MNDDGNNVLHRSGGDAESLDTTERELVAALRAPAAVDAWAFDARVMDAIRKERRHAIGRHRIHSSRIAAAMVACTALAAAVVFMMSGGRHGATIESPARSAAAAAVASRTVVFTLVASGASRVAVAGSFNGWNTAATPLRRVGKDTWAAEIPLGAGRYVYQFVIDGTRWVPDPRAPRDADDDFGAANSVVTVATPGSA